MEPRPCWAGWSGTSTSPRTCRSGTRLGATMTRSRAAHSSGTCKPTSTPVRRDTPFAAIGVKFKIHRERVTKADTVIYRSSQHDYAVCSLKNKCCPKHANAQSLALPMPIVRSTAGGSAPRSNASILTSSLRDKISSWQSAVAGESTASVLGARWTCRIPPRRLAPCSASACRPQGVGEDNPLRRRRKFRRLTGLPHHRQQFAAPAFERDV